MKNVILLAALVPQMAFANICKNVSPLAAQYEDQKTWESFVIESPETPVKLSAFVNQSGKVFIDDAIVKEKIEVKIDLEKSKKAQRYFKYYCHENPDKDALSSSRRLGKNNYYALSVQFLPTVENFKDNPYDSLETISHTVSLQYGSSSGVAQDYDFHKLKVQIEEHIQSELEEGKAKGEYRIDLTNWDDLVCDLIDGSVKINILHKMKNPEAKIKQFKEIPEVEISNLYSEWENSIPTNADAMSSAFVAGIGYQSLVSKQVIQELNSVDAVKVLKQATHPITGQFLKFDQNEKQCLVNSMIDYRKSSTNQYFNLDLIVDSKKVFDEDQ